MSEFLKGNFEVKRKITDEAPTAPRESGLELAETLRKAALASIGGSMVYMERTDLTWNGDDR